MGKPVITADSVGARECVRLRSNGEAQRAAQAPIREGHNGFLVEPLEMLNAVVQAMEHYLQHPDSLPVHRRESRKLQAEDVFDVRLGDVL